MLNVMGSFISTELDAFENLHKELEEKDKEIERLNRTNNEIFKANKTLVEEIKKLQNQLQQKENIIKEVREYITYWHYRNDFRIDSFTTGVKEELLEILDKEMINNE